MTARPLRITLIGLAIAALAVAAGGLAACGGSAAGQTKASASPSADAVVAHVNGQAVHQSAVDAVRAENRFDHKPDDPGQALDEAIDRELVRQEAVRLGMVPDSAEAKRRVAELVTQVGGQQTLADLLKEAKMTQQQLTDVLTYGVLREQVQNRRYPGITVSEASLRSFYRHNVTTLFTQPASVHLNAVVARNRGIASNALKRIKEGYPVAQVATQFSVDPQLKQQGGDMGWVLTSSLTPPSLRRAVAKLKVGEVSQPVQGIGGWYILQVVARRSARVVSFATVRDELKKELTSQARSSALDKWLKQARAKATITKP